MEHKQINVPKLYVINALKGARGKELTLGNLENNIVSTYFPWAKDKININKYIL